METKKKKVQVNIDRNLATNVDEILDSLGMTPTVLITALYKRVAARGEVPFDLSLTKEEKIAIDLANAVNLVPSSHVTSMNELEEWLNEDE